MDNVYMMASLCYIDTLERIDIFLYEARHIQSNIIHSLRAPLLYRGLRFEERTLWGDWHDALLKEYNGHTNGAAMAARNSTIDYPRPWKAIKDDDPAVSTSRYVPTDVIVKKLRDEGAAIRRSYKKFINEIWIGGLWTNEQQRYYHTLSTIQRIKRNVVKDRVILLFEGIRFFCLLQQPEKKKSCESEYLRRLGRLLCVRSAANERIHEAIARLGDCQEQFSKSQDMALNLDTPRPCLERRREQRLYTSHMSDRCRDIWKEYSYLWQEYIDDSKKEAPAMPILQHRWQHHVTSQWQPYVNIAVKKNTNGPCHDMHFINSSYFMPDRPDLLSLIGHEVAHAFLSQVLDGLTPQSLTADDSSFSVLVKEIVQSLEVFRYDERSNFPALSLAREMAVDILTASTQGPAYLYALTIEMIGFDLSNLYRFGNRSIIDLDIRDHIKGAGGDFDQSREWYLRLVVLCSFVNEISGALPRGTAKEQYSNKMYDGVLCMLDALLLYLEEISVPELKSAIFWKGLGNRLAKLVRHSPYVSSVCKFWERRETDYYGEQRILRKNDERQKPARTWPTCLTPLPDAARSLLLLWAKRFSAVSRMDGGTENMKSCGDLFEYLQDFPWQAAMLYMEDKVHNSDGKLTLLAWNQLIKLPAELAKIRATYSFGLEFDNAKLETPSVCLEKAVCALREINDTRVKKFIKENAMPAIKDRVTHGGICFENKQNGEIDKQLVELQQLMPKFFMQYRRKFKPVVGYLNEIINKKFMNERSDVFRAFLTDEDGGTVNRPFLIGRVSMGRMHKMIRNRALREYYIKPKKQKQVKDWNMELEHYSSTPLLGRHDSFVMMSFEGELFKIPKFANAEGNIGISEELFLPHFIRWEIGLPVRLGETPWTCPETLPNVSKLRAQGPLALLSISLTSSSSRLVFLSRLRVAIKQRESKQFPLYVEEFGALFDPADQAFLTDGWEDLTIVFYGEPDRIKQIFDIQRIIYNDFMVTRTEIVFSARALDIFKTSDEYAIRIGYREEDRAVLEWKKTQPQIDQAIKDDPMPGLQVSLAHTPGRLDGMVYISGGMESPTSGVEMESPSVYGHLLSWFAGCAVDRLQTDLCQKFKS